MNRRDLFGLVASVIAAPAVVVAEPSVSEIINRVLRDYHNSRTRIDTGFWLPVYCPNGDVSWIRVWDTNQRIQPITSFRQLGYREWKALPATVADLWRPVSAALTDS